MKRRKKPGTARRKTDPAELTFFSNLFTSIAEEMGVTLARTAYSPNIKERRDFSCGMFDSHGNMASQAAHIPVHLGAMPMSVAAAISRFGSLCEGDVVILNDPYSGGTHLPDITLVSPVIVQKTGLKRMNNNPIAFLVTRAHHADVGGMSPGSLPLSTEIYQEGLRIPPVKLIDAGTTNDAVLEIIKANSRTPDERIGDLRAQLAAHEVGSARVREVIEKYSISTFTEQIKRLQWYGRRLMESLIARIPDGSYRFKDRMDLSAQSGGDGAVKVNITVSGKKCRVDFTGSSRESKQSLNAVEPVTRSAVYYCFLAILATPSRYQEEAAASPPLNGGCFFPIEILAPKGSIVNARPPCAVAAGNVETSQRIVDAVFGALSKALPDIVPAASQGTMNNLTIGGRNPLTGKPFAYYETIGGGMGARPTMDGLDGIQAHMTNTMNTPIEALEFAYPLRLERYEIRRGSGGIGKQRGGCGIRRELRALCDATGTILGDRRTFAPYGLKGGRPGKPGQDAVIRNGKVRPIASKSKLELKAGDVISIRTPGGGGWGSKKS
ncbi:MAG: hydantoinase B/oxoprolinase family protein, partial [Nitrospinota bacterium]